MTNAIPERSICARFKLQRNDFCLDVDFKIPGKGITAIFGESGCGKTSLLRCLAGLEKIQHGNVSINGLHWQNQNQCIPTHKREVGFVFQEASLFPHLSVSKNIHYAIKRSATPSTAEETQGLASVLGISHLLDRYPHQISGGERQRVAIARALATKPKVLLMDEPLASLDTARKQEIMPYLESLHSELDIPVLYVSHSIDEVARLADHTMLMQDGKILAQGQVHDVLSRIDLPFDLGEQHGVVIEAVIQEQQSEWQLARATFDGGELWLQDTGSKLHQAIRLRILAKDISLTKQEHNDTSILNKLAAEVIEISKDNTNAMALVRLKVGSNFLVARVTRKSLHCLNISVGMKLWAQIKSVAIVQ